MPADRILAEDGPCLAFRDGCRRRRPYPHHPPAPCRLLPRSLGEWAAALAHARKLAGGSPSRRPLHRRLPISAPTTAKPPASPSSTATSTSSPAGPATIPAPGAASLTSSPAKPTTPARNRCKRIFRMHVTFSTPSRYLHHSIFRFQRSSMVERLAVNQ